MRSNFPSFWFALFAECWCAKPSCFLIFASVPFAAMASKPDIVKFLPFTSSVDVGFWFELAKKKLDELKLDERELPVTGFFGLSTNADPPARFNMEALSFDKNFAYVFRDFYMLIYAAWLTMCV